MSKIIGEYQYKGEFRFKYRCKGRGRLQVDRKVKVSNRTGRWRLCYGDKGHFGVIMERYLTLSRGFKNYHALVFIKSLDKTVSVMC